MNPFTVSGRLTAGGMRSKTMKKCNSYFFLYIGFMFSVLLFLTLSCSSPDGHDTPDDPPPGDGPITAPENVTASRDGEKIIITWEKVDNADKYFVYRKDGQGDFLPVPGDGCEDVTYIDMSFPLDLVIQYAVASQTSNGDRSVLSPPSNTLSYMVQRISATAYERQDGIYLEWALHPEDPDNYKIYRYRAKNLPPEVIYTVTTNTYLDQSADPDGPEKDTPCFYKVTWEKTQTEYGTNVSHVFGIFGDTIDYGEPNNDLSTAKELTSGAPAVTAKLFSFSDGCDGVAADVDWYLYHGPATYEMIATVTIPADTPFSGDEVRFSWYFDGTQYPENILDTGENIQTFGDFGGAAGDIDLYCKIYAVVDSTLSKNGTYSISISDEFKKIKRSGS